MPIMKRIALAVALLLATFAAHAQIYQWHDENNKTVISDRPPVGKVKDARAVASESSSAAGESGKTFADREMEFRQRQKESRESAEEAAKEQRLAAQKKEGCENARRALGSLESGERVSMRDSRGERYYLDDQQREQEIGKLRREVQSKCP